MICKNKIGNLHTSYKPMADGIHLTAYFGVNIKCAVNEVLKFPDLFNMSEIALYLDDIKIIPKIKNVVFLGNENYTRETYLAEDKFITPKIVLLSNVSKNIAYFTFDQHFNPLQVRKYKVKMSVKDHSITKALAAKETFLNFNKRFTNLRSNDQVTQEIADEAKQISRLALRIRSEKNKVYYSVLEAPSVNLKLITLLSTALKEEVKFIDDLTKNKQEFRLSPEAAVDLELFEIKKNKELKQSFWNGIELRPKIKEELLKISNKFIESLDKVKEVEDILFHGSLAGYYYDDESDLDLQIVIDFDKINLPPEEISSYFFRKYASWKNRFKIQGHVVQITVQNSKLGEKSGSDGIYSLLNNRWDKFPNSGDELVSNEEINNRVNTFINRYRDIAATGTPSDFKKLYQEIRSARVNAFKVKKKESTIENLAFKVLKRTGLLKEIEARTRSSSRNYVPGTLVEFDKEFKQEISFPLLKEFSTIPIKKDENSVQFALTKENKVKKVESVPEFKVEYSKKHLFEHKQTLKEKAPNYDISFVNNVDQNLEYSKKSFTFNVVTEKIYVLSGHNNDDVTAEHFVPLEETINDLPTGATYLCKTNMVEAKQQYFILER